MPFSMSEEDYYYLADLEIKILDILAVDLTGIVNEHYGYVYYTGQTYSRIAYVDAFGGVQFQFPVTKQTFILMPYITVQGGIQMLKWDNLEIQLSSWIQTASFSLISKNLNQS